MARKMMDCRDIPNDVGCTLVIIGEEDEVVLAAAQHATSIHQELDSEELRARIRASLRDEPPELSYEGAEISP
jgi:Protein of unknown function (DUF1059)